MNPGIRVLVSVSWRRERAEFTSEILAAVAVAPVPGVHQPVARAEMPFLSDLLELRDRSDL